MKIGCVIQGDVRRGTSWVLNELPRLFDFTVLSTWSEDKDLVPPGAYTLALSNKPNNYGITNRNLQRLLTSKGIQVARDAGCEYVLKWRTDMLPTKLDVSQLLEWAAYKIPSGMNSRIAMPAFRNLSVTPDWLSSIPDLFAFGHIDEMEMLWGEANFDYALDMNIPNEMAKDLSGKLQNLASFYCAESELYAIFKERLQLHLGFRLTHPQIALDYLRLFDHRRLGIYWFGREGGFRSIAQGWEHHWWTEANWQRADIKISPSGYLVSGIRDKILAWSSPFRVMTEQYRQAIAWEVR